MDGICKIALSYSHRDKKLFQQHFARMSRGTIGRNTDHFILLMIIHDLDLIRTLLPPKKKDAILGVDAYAVLTLPFTAKRLKPVTGWDMKFLQVRDRVELIQFASSYLP
jgi:hypothetical protein